MSATRNDCDLMGAAGQGALCGGFSDWRSFQQGSVRSRDIPRTGWNRASRGLEPGPAWFPK
jgi:hypothetical protein